jgi:hypothetical protein
MLFDASDNHGDGLQPICRVNPDWHVEFHALLLNLRILDHQAQIKVSLFGILPQ